MQCIYTYIPETNCVPREYSVADILLLLFMVLISLVSVLNLLYFYFSTFRNMCAVPIIIIIIIIIIIWASVLRMLFILMFVCKKWGVWIYLWLGTFGIPLKTFTI